MRSDSQRASSSFARCVHCHRSFATPRDLVSHLTASHGLSVDRAIVAAYTARVQLLSSEAVKAQFAGKTIA